MFCTPEGREESAALNHAFSVSDHDQVAGNLKVKRAAVVERA